MARRRRVGLNSRDLAELSREIHAQAQGIRGGATASAMRICEEVGLPKALELCRSSRVRANIHVERTATGAALVADGPEASYTEFGTGVVGQAAGFPNELDAAAAMASGYVHDGMGHGEAGWFYWDDGAWHWTKGLAGWGYMGAAAEAMRREGAAIAMTEMVSDMRKGRQ